MTLTPINASIDFGESIIPVSGNDAFFLDTNMIVAHLYAEHEKHLPCFCFISYLIKNDVTLCTSEIVIVELINTLARIFFIDDRYRTHVAQNGEPQNNKGIRELQYRFKRLWSDSVIKHQPEVLKHFNALASRTIKPFIEGTLIVEISDEIVNDTLDLVTNTPLASADAMIVSTSLNFGCGSIISIDRDVSAVSNVHTLTTNTKNSDYNIVRMLNDMDIVHYLVDKMGESDFKIKFPNITVPTP